MCRLQGEGRERGLSACLSAATTTATTTIIHGPLYGWPSTYRQMKRLASAGHKLMKVKLKFFWWGPARPGLASLNSTRMLSAMPQSLVARTHLRTNGHRHTHTQAQEFILINPLVLSAAIRATTKINMWFIALKRDLSKLLSFQQGGGGTRRTTTRRTRLSYTTLTHTHTQT